MSGISGRCGHRGEYGFGSCRPTCGEPRYHQPSMAEELWQTLTRFHREVIAPDLRDMVDEALVPLREEIAASRRDNERHFDAIYKRLDTIDSEIQSLRAAVKRLEEDVAVLKADVATLKADVAALKLSVESEAAARAELRQELDQIKAQIAELQEKAAQIEAQLNPPTSAPA
ncbi:MAG TPA: hypothetical protein VG323_04955 [Thermoanaerobaculia bacterium]|nr:hypothetical protein [Thermoanaerobaculia bacterium]